MNIIVFSDSAWDDTNSFGNTVSNFFDGNAWNNDIFYNIYMRSCKPNNRVCKKYFQIKPTDLIKYYFKKNNIGKEFEIDNFKNKNNNEGNQISFIHKYKLNFVYVIMDFLYRRRKWINNNFDCFVKNAKPDIFFAFLTNFSMLNQVITYMKKNTHAKIVIFIADDVYGDLNTKSIIRQKKLKKEFLNIINNADQIYGISEDLCNEYSKLFNVKIDFLCKGCSFDYPTKTKVNKIIKFVYAGNLFYGRDEILEKIGKAIEKNNNISDTKAILEIYTGMTYMSDELNNKLNIKNASVIKGRKDYNEIKKIMNDADYNLQIESFEEKQIDYVKYSFSTKIIDCFQSGSSSIAIGPSSIASIKYMKKVPGVIIIDNINEIETKIISLINNSNNIINNSKKIREYAVKNHDINKNQQMLKNKFKNLINK